MFSEILKKHLLKSVALTGALMAMTAPSPVLASHVSSSAAAKDHDGPSIIIPIMNAQKGKDVFVDKGCIACHAVNGVGGHDAIAMDAHKEMTLVNPFDFAAKMWNHAPAMIAAQEEAFGEQIYFTGEELANIIAFLHDEQVQHGFSEKSLTKKAIKMMGHSHGEKTAPEAHAEEVGHGHEGEEHKD